MLAGTSGRRYKITETGTQLTEPLGHTIPRESVLLVPDYIWVDKLGTANQGAPPGTASVGPATSACNTDSLIYQSDSNGLGRIVRAVIAISGPAAGAPAGVPFNWSLGENVVGGIAVGQGSRQDFTTWKPVTPDQFAGSYSGTITFTLTLN